MSNNNEKMEAPGSLVLAIIFLVWFVVVYATQWAALTKNWFVN
ncbi:MAG: hypothetical protein OEZ34_03800 [Spirochaetia bacterium]|nr:hypothetical protein [Spirochaetia bacterium]